MAEAPDSSAVVSVEQDGRTLSGVGTTEEALHAVMDRHAPADPDAPPAEPSPPSDTAPPVEPPKPTRGQARFSELTQKAKDAEAKAAALEKERDDLKARLSQAAPAVQAPRPESAAPVQSRPEPATKPRPQIDQFATWDDYETARDTWVQEQTIQALKLDERINQRLDYERSQQQFLTQVEQTRVSARKVYADFDEVITKGPGAQVLMSRDRLEAIIAAPHSEHLQYLIAKDGALAQRLAQASPIAFGMELAKLAPASQLPANGQSQPQAPPPAPYQPVGAGSPTTLTPSSELASKGFDFDKSGYRSRRDQELGRKPKKWG